MKYENRLFQLRGSMSQADMAKRLGLSQQNYGNYENGKQGLKSDLILKICKEFGCTAEWLLCLDRKDIGEAWADPRADELDKMFRGMDETGRSSLIACAQGLYERYKRKGGDMK